MIFKTNKQKELERKQEYERQKKLSELKITEKIKIESLESEVRKKDICQ